MSCRLHVQGIWHAICLLPLVERCCDVSPFHHTKGEHRNIMGLHQDSATVRPRTSLKAEAYFRMELLFPIRCRENDHIDYRAHAHLQADAQADVGVRYLI